MYGLLDSSLVNTGYGIATWCFLTGGLLASIVSFKVAVVTALVGNVVGTLLVALAVSIISHKYGIDTYSSIGVFFGKIGMKIVFAVFIITNLGWVVVLGSMCARSSHSLSDAITGSTMPAWGITILTIVAVAIMWFIVYKGPAALKMMNRIMVPGLCICMLIMIIALISKNSFADIWNAEAMAPYPSKTVNIILALELNIGAGISWWPGIGALGRLNKTATTTVWGNMIGLAFAPVLVALLSAASAYTVGSSDPTEWMIPLGGIGFGALALFFVILANLSSGSYAFYNTCLGLKNYNVFANRKWIVVTACFLVPVIVLCFFQDFVYGNYQMLLNFSVAIFGPMSIIQILDYYVFRRKHIDLRALYDTTSSSDMRYNGGGNWGGIIILAISIIIYCVILNPATWAYASIFPYVSAFIPSCAFALVAYYLYGKFYLQRKGVGGFAYADRYEEAVKK
ncbi:MAG: cytosine permease [Bacillota bacterium]|nr:cytosine permease [Bacillota bacterium]